MNTKTEEALETYINGNISDARKYFSKHKGEVSIVVEYLLENERKEEVEPFLRLMLRGGK